MVEKKQKVFLYFIVTLVVMILGCRATFFNTPTSPVPSPIASATRLLESPTLIATLTDFPTMTPSATLYPGEVEYRCINVSNDPTQLGNLSGTLVLNGYLDPSVENNPSLLLDVRSGNQIPLAIDESTDRIVISPSGSYLAFDVWEGNNSNKWQINVLDSMGGLLANAVEKDLTSMEWLNDKILLLNILNPLDERWKHNPLIFLSPFDYKEEIVDPFLSEAERIAPFDHELIYTWGFYSYHKIIYNPTLTRAVYAASDLDGSKIVFRDLISNQDISAFHTQAWGISPKWSSDGTKFAIGVNTNYSQSANLTEKYELVVFDQNGEQLFITHLSTLPGPVYISSLSWSPDGSRVAFWYTTNEDTNRDLRLAILDTMTQKTIDYCIIYNPSAHIWHRNDTSPIWSPDGNFLLIETPNADNNPNVVIVDLVQEIAAVIKTDYEPVGWMK